MSDDLGRFLEAQADPDRGWEAALAELRAGRKTGHWIWYILPQLDGLGQSPMAVRYGLRGVGEAAAFLEHPVLRQRLSDVIDVVASQLAAPAPGRVETLMGSAIDARKLVSSMTLFAAVADRLAAARPDETGYTRLANQARLVLDETRRQKLPPCEFTERALLELS